MVSLPRTRDSMEDNEHGVENYLSPPVGKKVVTVPEEAVFAAHSHLEDAECMLGYFIREAKPKDDHSEGYVNRMKTAREELRKFIRKWEPDFYEITEDLPEGGE